MTHIKKTGLRIILQLHRCWWQMLVIHLIYTALGTAVFVPLLGLVSRLLLKLSGEPALADEDIAHFLFSPAGFLTLVVFSALLIVILAIEQATMMNIAIHDLHEKRISTIEAIRRTVARLKTLYLFAVYLVIRILLLVLPFLVITAVIAVYLIFDYDINYYLSAKPPEFLLAATLIAIVLLVALVVLAHQLTGWALALPLILFNGFSAITAFRESAQRVKGHRINILLGLLIWALIAIVAGFIVLKTVFSIGSWMIPVSKLSISVLVILLGAFNLLWLIGNILIITANTGSLAFLITAYYERIGPTFDLNAFDTARSDSGAGIYRTSPKTLVITLISAFVFAVLSGLWMINDIQTEDDVVIIAHRGASGKAPENTLAAVRQAISDESDWIEVDVQESRDGKVVVMHDSDFMKLAGYSLKIWEATFEQMQEIDIGSRFDTNFADERTPTLEQVLEVTSGKSRVLVELKYYGHDQNLEQRVIDIIERRDMMNETAIMSLSYGAVKKVRALRPDWNVGYLSATAIGNLSRLDADFLAVAMGMASVGFIKRTHEAGKQVFVWTVNDAASMSRMMSLGVDGIITDEPALAKQVLKEREEMTYLERLLVHTVVLFDQPIAIEQ